MSEQKDSYNRLTPLMCARLAAPHTWPGPSVLTTVFGGVFSAWMGYSFNVGIWCLLLLCAVAAQSAVNTLNDWADFRAGTDTAENSDDPTDAVLVYDHPDPKHVLILGIAYMAVALVSGVACVIWCGNAAAILLGVIGGIFIVCYSSGKLPISYFPLGEVVSGVVMGCFIPLADICIFAAAGSGCGWLSLSFMDTYEWANAVVATVPFVIGVGMVMATQNCCDIERDQPIGRRTAAVLLGRKRFRIVYRVLTVVWIGSVLHMCFYSGCAAVMWVALVCMVLGAGTIRFLFITPLTHEVRGPSMGAVIKANLFINGAYCLCFMAAQMPAMM